MRTHHNVEWNMDTSRVGMECGHVLRWNGMWTYQGEAWVVEVASVAVPED